jgi:hypothetical protein
LPHWKRNLSFVFVPARKRNEVGEGGGGQGLAGSRVGSPVAGAFNVKSFYCPHYRSFPCV